VADDEAAIEAALSAAAADCDAVVTTGGVSMGDFDYVKVVLDRLGAMRWMQIAIKPAKPLAFGTIGDTPVFGLPGNPVSSMVSFELFARPALRRMMGHPEPDARTVAAVAAEPLRRRADGKIHFARVSAAVDADGVIRVRSAGGQGSHQLSAMAGANALAVLPDGEGAELGGAVDLLLLGELPGIPA
jgi:molybdopterin biosynthesis enzyme